MAVYELRNSTSQKKAYLVWELILCEKREVLNIQGGQYYVLLPPQEEMLLTFLVTYLMNRVLLARCWICLSWCFNWGTSLLIRIQYFLHILCCFNLASSSFNKFITYIFCNLFFLGQWWHWNHEYIAQWDKNDHKVISSRRKHKTNPVFKVYPSGAHNPPLDIGANFYPALGPYSSKDPQIITRYG